MVRSCCFSLSPGLKTHPWFRLSPLTFSCWFAHRYVCCSCLSAFYEIMFFVNDRLRTFTHFLALCLLSQLCVLEFVFFFFFFKDLSFRFFLCLIFSRPCTLSLLQLLLLFALLHFFSLLLFPSSFLLKPRWDTSQLLWQDRHFPLSSLSSCPTLPTFNMPVKNE